MDELTQELIAASLALRPFLEASTDGREGRAYYLHADRDVDCTRAERLRRQADDIEAEDAAVIRFRNALAAISPTHGGGAEA